MYADGMLGNGGVIQQLGSLVTGVFNYMRAPHSQPHSLKSILGASYGYIFNDVEVSPSDSLLMFMSQAQGFDSKLFKG